MVSIEEVAEASTATMAASDERRLDAEEIESLLSSVKRPTAKMQLEALAKKLRKEASALKIVEKSSSSSSSTTDAKATETPVPSPVPAPAPTPVPIATPTTTTTASSSDAVQYKVIDPFSFDAGGSMDQYVSIYLPLKGVGSISKDNIKCQFDKDGFDITVQGLDGTNYRLKKDNLEHDIVPDKSKFVVKANKIILKLAKVKGEYGSYDFWSKLTDPRKKEKAASKSQNKDNPMAGLNDLMREMYENGDDKTRKMIGETMLKQRNGELGGGLGGGGGMGGLDGMDLDGLDDEWLDEEMNIETRKRSQIMNKKADLIAAQNTKNNKTEKKEIWQSKIDTERRLVSKEEHRLLHKPERSHNTHAHRNTNSLTLTRSFDWMIISYRCGWRCKYRTVCKKKDIFFFRYKHEVTVLFLARTKVGAFGHPLYRLASTCRKQVNKARTLFLFPFFVGITDGHRHHQHFMVTVTMKS